MVGLFYLEELLHLATDGHGEGLDKEDVFRDFEVGLVAGAGAGVTRFSEEPAYICRGSKKNYMRFSRPGRFLTRAISAHFKKTTHTKTYGVTPINVL